MPDQADQLRELVRETLVTAASPAGFVAVAGCTPGVGATSLVLGTARELASLGARVLAVDANLRRPAIGERLGLSPGSDLSSVLAGRRRLNEASVPAPFGAVVLSVKDPVEPATCSLESLERLCRELHAAAERFDAILVDVGAEFAPWTDRLCRRAAETIVLGTTRSDDVRHAYARVKSLSGTCALRLALSGRYDAVEQLARKIGETALEFTGANPLTGATVVLPAGEHDDSLQSERRRAYRLLAAEVLAPLRIAQRRVARPAQGPVDTPLRARDRLAAVSEETLSWPG